MNMLHMPSKEQIRAYLAQRQSEHRPPPDLVEIRRQLGWDLVRESRQADTVQP